MNKTFKSILLWTLCFIFTVMVAYYQRKTGPTHPITTKIELNDRVIKNNLLTSFGGDGDAVIKIETPDQAYEGVVKYKRFKSFDEWTEVPLERNGDHLIVKIPHQPPAGKVDYLVILKKGDQTIQLTEKPVRIRFKGAVPMWVLISHIITIFFAMVLSTRTGAEVLFKGPNVYPYTIATIVFLLIGGLILGPIMQNYAFGAYWTGWPFGHDLTDNKTIVAFIFWIVAFFVLRKNQLNTKWALIASIILLLVYLIPHSVLGSEIDYTAQ